MHHAPLSEDEKSQVLKLLEMQRHAMLMYTSCGWFFDDISGIETLQVLRYACRAMQLAKEISGTDHEPVFIASLFEAKSNTPDHADGATIYRDYVRHSMIDPTRMIFNYALMTLITGTTPSGDQAPHKNRKDPRRGGIGRDQNDDRDNFPPVRDNGQ